jgi:photosystem II stability/assembly factor-like uncharacterized protein
MQSLIWRCIGPPRGGRVVAVAGHPTEAMTAYFGACAGGVWKTSDGGTYWENISDGHFTSAAVGAIAVSDADPNVLYAGTGEATIRLDVSYGDGVYRSTDGGQSWVNCGLRDTHHIAKIRIHPRNPDLVYVAALGHAFGPNAERGVFRSQDGGQSWEKILYQSDKTGAVDLAMDAQNPRILYAAMYETYRNFWSLSSGGPESGLWKSADGGDTWTDLTANPGLPAGLKGKIGVTVSPANPNRVWAIIEAEGEKAGVYRSDNGGATWEQVSNNRDLMQRPWYYCHIFADPKSADTVYVLNLKMWKSTDGGKSYSEITTPHGDNHDLWIDPANPLHMVQGNDGGACLSYNGGATWSTIYNQLTAQFYRMAVDNQVPYRVYGTQQDNSSISVPSATEKGCIPWSDCYAAGTGESGFIAVHPQDANIVYVGAVGSSPGGGGALQRYDHRIRQIRLVTVWPEAYTGWGAGDLKYRFPWTFPILFSPHDPNILYSTGNHVFRSTDEGGSWQEISPDLTRADPEKLLASGGPITLDTSGAEHYCTISALVESPHEPGVLWAGSDDGLIHLTRDGGGRWQQVTPPGLPEWTLISSIEVSPHDPAMVWVAATRYKLDDYLPYLYKSSDYGQTWQRIDGSFPTYAGKSQITRVLREDPVQPGLLYVGTETGVYVSLDGGAGWQRMEGSPSTGPGQALPVAPVYDLLVKEGDLVVATHGRSFWILDDLTPLRETSAGRGLPGLRLFPPRPTVRQALSWGVDPSRGPEKNYSMGLGATITFCEGKGSEGEPVRRFLDGGENPPNGVIVYYSLPDPLPAPVTLTFLDAEGKEIRSFTTKPAPGEKIASEKPASDKAGSENKSAEERTIPARSGLNRFVWDLRYPNAVKVPGDVTTEKAVTGPRAAPGNYQVRLQAGEQTATEDFTVRADPRVRATEADFQAQFALGLQIRDKIEQTHAAINRLRRIRQQVTAWSARAQARAEGENIVQAASELETALTAIERELIQTEAKTGSDRLRLKSRLNTKLIGLISVVSSADAAPTQQARDVFAHLSAQVDEQLARLHHLIEEDVAEFNELVDAAKLTPVAVE